VRDRAADAIGRIVPGARIHATGYCLGGRCSRSPPPRSAATAVAAANPDAARAQTDFSAPGELGLFTDESQVAFLEQLMSRRGYLDKKQMQSTFQMLRSNDLIWSVPLHSQLLGERRPVTDLMAWNADGTRLPARMHSEYLRGMFLDNALRSGEWRVDGRPVNLADIRAPIFSVGTVQDHVAPWRSVFKLHALTDAEQTFVLTAGGHNVGIVNPPGQAKSSYRLRTWHAGDRLLTPDEWVEATTPVADTWWTPWFEWLSAHSSRAARRRRWVRPGTAWRRWTPRPASMSTSVEGSGTSVEALARSLLLLADTPGPERITISELIGALGDRSAAALVLLLALPNVLPMPPGTSAVLGAPLLLLTLQMVSSGRARLPATLARRSFARKHLAPLLRQAAARLGRRGSGPHLGRFASPLGVRLTGIVCSLLALLVFLPIPFGNMAPACAISMCAFGILRHDGRWVLGGLVAGLVSIAILGAALYGLGQLFVYASQLVGR
jgi:hypothetical protein